MLDTRTSVWTSTRESRERQKFEKRETANLNHITATSSNAHRENKKPNASSSELHTQPPYCTCCISASHTHTHPPPSHQKKTLFRWYTQGGGLLWISPLPVPPALRKPNNYRNNRGHVIVPSIWGRATKGMTGGEQYTTAKSRTGKAVFFTFLGSSS